MSTVEDVARHVAGITGTEDDLLLIASWVSERWKELANTNTLRMLRCHGELVTTPSYSDGTIDVTNGSQMVTGNSTAFTTAMVGRYLRQKTNWHRIESVSGATSLTLESPFTEDTTTGSGYDIVQRWHRLSPDIRKLMPTFGHMRLRRPLHLVTPDSIDMMIPSRYSINQVPQYVIEIEPDVDGTKRVEIYPYPANAELITYVYWRKPPDLKLMDELPAFIDIEAFREGVMVDVMRHKMFKLMEMGKQRESELMRNEYQATLSRWNSQYKIRVLGQEDALDDLEFTLMRSGARPSWGGADNRIIDDAYSHVWFTR